MIAARNPVAPAGVEAEAASLAGLPSSASAALVAMVEEWRSLLDRINDDGTSDEAVVSLGDRHNALQRAIYDFPAASVADLLAKEPVFRCEMQDAVSGLADGFEPAETLAGAAWLGLFRDFERLAVAPLPAHPDAALLALRLPFLAAWRDAGAASPLFDPAPMSIAALAALYDAARGAAEHLDALGGGPGDPERVGVRAVIGGEAERLRGVMLACADALAEREPRTLAERRARARVRAMHAVEVGDWADLAGAEGGR